MLLSSTTTRHLSSSGSTIKANYLTPSLSHSRREGKHCLINPFEDFLYWSVSSSHKMNAFCWLSIFLYLQHIEMKKFAWDVPATDWIVFLPTLWRQEVGRTVLLAVHQLVWVTDWLSQPIIDFIFVMNVNVVCFSSFCLNSLLDLSIFSFFFEVSKLKASEKRTLSSCLFVIEKGFTNYSILSSKWELIVGSYISLPHSLLGYFFCIILINL